LIGERGLRIRGGKRLDGAGNEGGGEKRRRRD